jgi:hypothetical protein
MVIRDGRFGRFLACSSYPQHQESRPLLAPLGVACPVCGGDIVEKHTRTGSTFFGCVTYPTCSWTSSYRPLSEACPSCGGVQVALDKRRRHCLKHQGSPPRPAVGPTPSEPGSRKAPARKTRATGRQDASVRRTSRTSASARKSEARPRRRPPRPKS